MRGDLFSTFAKAFSCVFKKLPQCVCITRPLSRHHKKFPFFVKNILKIYIFFKRYKKKHFLKRRRKRLKFFLTKFCKRFKLYRRRLFLVHTIKQYQVLTLFIVVNNLKNIVYKYINILLISSLLTSHKHVSLYIFTKHLHLFIKFCRFVRPLVKRFRFIKRRNFLFLLNLFLLFFFKKSWFFIKFIRKAFWKKKKDNVRKIIYFLRSFFKKFSYFFFKLFQVVGLLFFFKGKINSYGNSRKKILRLNFGLLNSTNFHTNINTGFCSFINKSGKTKCRLSLFF